MAKGAESQRSYELLSLLVSALALFVSLGSVVFSYQQTEIARKQADIAEAQARGGAESILIHTLAPDQDGGVWIAGDGECRSQAKVQARWKAIFYNASTNPSAITQVDIFALYDKEDGRLHTEPLPFSDQDGKPVALPFQIVPKSASTFYFMFELDHTEHEAYRRACLVMQREQASGGKPLTLRQLLKKLDDEGGVSFGHLVGGYGFLPSPPAVGLNIRTGENRVFSEKAFPPSFYVDRPPRG
jgi:hypothetical protein